MVDVGLYIAYGLILIALIAAIGFPIIYMIKHPKEAKTALIGVGLVVVVFALAYVFSSGEFYFTGIEKYNLSDNQIKLVGAGLNTFYALAGIAILATIVTEVKSAIK